MLINTYYERVISISFNSINNLTRLVCHFYDVFNFSMTIFKHMENLKWHNKHPCFPHLD